MAVTWNFLKTSYPVLMTMPDLTWTVTVHQWTWVYTFSHKGGVTWRDPANGMHGSGTWRIDKGKLITRWTASSTYEEWNLPLNLRGTLGKCHMEEGTYDLRAVTRLLVPGDVVAVKDKKYVIYPDEIRQGGTVAWLCRNPGNIREGDKFGAYPGKKYQTAAAGAFAIFPTEEIGRQGILKVLKIYGHVTITQAINKYAPRGDGKNDPDKYGREVATGIGGGVKTSTYIDTLNSDQLDKFAEQIKRVEGWVVGNTIDRHSTDLPDEIRGRLPERMSLSEEEGRNLMGR